MHLLRARNQAWSYANSVVALEAIEYFLELLAEPRDVNGDHSADDVDLDVEICVGEYHSRPDDVAPGDHPGMGVLGRVGDSGGGFAEDLALELTGDGDEAAISPRHTKFPTGALATLQLGKASWDELTAGQACLADLALPRPPR